jgi:FKBP-type peptidyl-prolyl cis-trans isomerase
MNLPTTVLTVACSLAVTFGLAQPLLAEDEAPATQPQQVELQIEEADLQTPPPPSMEDISYALGFTMAADMVQRDIGIDKEQLMEGFAAGFGQQSPRLSQEQMAMSMFSFQMMMQQEQMAQQMQAAQENLAIGLAFLEANAQEEGVTTTDSGLQYKVLAQGDGPTPTAEDTVSAHYTGKLIDGTVFDSSRERGPASFPVGKVIAGWTQALQMMKVGDKWELVIPADLAYGEEGRPGIPPNAVLLFEVELLGIE